LGNIHLIDYITSEIFENCVSLYGTGAKFKHYSDDFLYEQIEIRFLYCVEKLNTENIIKMFQNEYKKLIDTCNSINNNIFKYSLLEMDLLDRNFRNKIGTELEYILKCDDKEKNKYLNLFGSNCYLHRDLGRLITSYLLYWPEFTLIEELQNIR